MAINASSDSLRTSDRHRTSWLPRWTNLGTAHAPSEGVRPAVMPLRTSTARCPPVSVVVLDVGVCAAASHRRSQLASARGSRVGRGTSFPWSTHGEYEFCGSVTSLMNLLSWSTTVDPATHRLASTQLDEILLTGATAVGRPRGGRRTGDVRQAPIKADTTCRPFGELSELINITLLEQQVRPASPGRCLSP